MIFKYRNKEYDSSLPLEVLSLRDLGAYILIRYPNIKQGQFVLDRGYDSILAIYTIDSNGEIKKDDIIFYPTSAAFSNPTYFRTVEERLEKIFLKRGLI